MVWITVAYIEKKENTHTHTPNQYNDTLNEMLNLSKSHIHSNCSSEANDCSTGSSKFGIIFNIDLSFIAASNGFIDDIPCLLSKTNQSYSLAKLCNEC